MNVVVTPDHAAASAFAYTLVADAIQATPALVLGLPTGRTVVTLYGLLADARLDWSAVRTFNLDEFAGIAPSHSGSFRAFMDVHLFNRTNLAPAHIDFLRGAAADVEAECRRYDDAMAAVGGLGLLLLGLGANGHIGFNEPGPALTAATHVTALHASTRAANAALFGDDAARVPARALTIGMRAVLGAGRIVMLATGPAKADAVGAMVRGPLSTACPASWLQVHPEVTLVLDEASASRLA